MRRHITRPSTEAVQIITARSYNNIPAETAGLLAKDIPLHIKIIEISVEWLLEHKHPIPYWGHLTPAETDTDGEVYPGDQLSTATEVRRKWKKNHQEAWKKIWEEHTKSKWMHRLFPKSKNT